MMTVEELEKLQKEEDDYYKSEMRHELDLRLRQHIVDWSRKRHGNFLTAAYSAVNGAWDDVRKDVRRGRITVDQAIEILDRDR